MTDDQMQTVRDDIAYLKALADEGRQAPLLGGAILLSAGLIFGAASVVHWAVAAGVLDLSPTAFAIVWGVAAVAFLLALFVLSAQIKTRPGANSTGNRGMSASWGGMGIASFFLFVGFAIIATRYGGEILGVLIPPVIIALYGAGWWAAGELSNKRWLTVVAWCAFIASPVMAWLGDRPEQYLAYAAALVLLAGLPGLILMRGEPAEVI